MSGHWLDLSTWPRRDHYQFFLAYEQPFFNLCTEVQVGPTWRWCKATGAPFSLACWFAAQRATDAVPALRMRLRPEGVWLHDQLYIASTISLPGDTFGFCYFPRAPTFAAFRETAEAAIAQVRAGAPMGDRPDEDGVIHGSVVPWVRFTGLTHARRLGTLDSVPKLVFGKASAAGEGMALPVSVAAHHALADGVHVAQFLGALEAALAQPEVTFAG